MSQDFWVVFCCDGELRLPLQPAMLDRIDCTCGGPHSQFPWTTEDDGTALPVFNDFEWSRERAIERGRSLR